MASMVKSMLGIKSNTAPPLPATSGQNLPVQGSQSTSSDTGFTAVTYADVTSATPQVSVINLDLRGYFTPFNIPTLERIIYAVQALFKPDEGLRIQQLRGAGTGIYRILLSKPVENINGIFVTFKNQDEIIKVPLAIPQPSNQNAGGQGRREGLLVTFLNADAGSAIQIPAKTFDEAMKPYGDVIKCTEQQRYRGTSCLNTNRYCVIDNQGKDKVPGTISVVNPRTNQTETFQVRYRGQSWHCRRCSAEHVGPCPSLKEFFEAKEARKKKEINIKIFADSTLRCAERIGLTADVSCMSGGGVGQVANAIRDDPAMDAISTTVVIAGVNDSANKLLSEEEFAYTIDKGVEKLTTEMEKNNANKLVVLNIVDTPVHDWYHVDQRQKRQAYIAERWAVVKDNERLRALSMETGAIEWDETGHPTEKGTRTILQQLETLLPGLIWNTKYTSTSRKYQGVEGLFMYGCKCCGDIQRYLGKGICAECQAAASTYQNPQIWKAVEATAIAHPIAKKRAHDEGDEESEPKKTNVNNGGN